MPRDTQQAILIAAKKLFNERGYNNVTTRDIADELGISKGNLTYHFKKKEDIIEALMTGGPGHTPLDAPTNLAELNTYLEDIQTIAHENAFYFWHHSQLAQVSPAISELQRVAFATKSADLLASLHVLADQNLVAEEAYPKEYDHVVDALLLAGIYWVPFCKLREEDSSSGFAQQAWAILYPHLTPKGKDTLQKMQVNFLAAHTEHRIMRSGA